MSDNNDFAVVRINSRQYLVQVGSSFKVDRVNENDDFDVLLCQSGGDLFIGEPEVTEVGVKIEIIEDTLDKKIEVRRFRAKSRHRRHKGHRQPVTFLKVSEIKKGSKNKLVKIASKKSEEVDSKTDVSSGGKGTIKPLVGKIKKDSVEKKSLPTVKSSAGVEKSELESLKISSIMKKHLRNAGFDTAEKIKSAGKKDILRIKGIGPKAAEKILDEAGKNS